MNEDTDRARLLRRRLLSAEERPVDPQDTTTVALHGHEGVVTAVGISPDNHWLVTGGAEK